MTLIHRHRGPGHAPGGNCPYRRLGAEIVWRAIADLCSPSTYLAGEREDVERWIGSYPTKDFRIVCDLAGLEAEAAWSRLRALADLPVKERARWFHENSVCDRTKERRETETRVAPKRPQAFDATVFRPRTPLRHFVERAAKEAGVPVDVILGPSRRRPVSKPRQRAMADAWQAGWSSTQVGRAFGGRDHSTVMHAVSQMERGRL